MRPLALVLLVAAAAWPQQPADQSADQSLKSDIRRLMKDAGVDQLMTQGVDRMLASVLAFMRQNPQLTPEFVEEAGRRMRAHILDGHIQEMIVSDYARAFTHDEILQMIAYQESPIGRKVARVMPGLLQDLSSKLQQEGRGLGQQIAAEIIKEHPEYLRKAPTQTQIVPSGGVVGSVPPPPPPPPPPSPSGSASRSVSTTILPPVAEANLIKKVDPIYPPLAKSVRVQGTVRWRVLINTDGTVKSAELISGHPLLVNAAREAVLQWVYQPFELDGKAVEVLTEVTINFHLDTAN